MVKDNFKLESGYSMKAGTYFHFDYFAFHMDKKDWENPAKFIPERFDMQSE
jgi:cytochrome P450